MCGPVDFGALQTCISRVVELSALGLTTYALHRTIDLLGELPREGLARTKAPLIKSLVAALLFPALCACNGVDDAHDRGDPQDGGQTCECVLTAPEECVSEGEVEGVQTIEVNIGPSSPSTDHAAYVDLSTGAVGLTSDELEAWDIYFWLVVMGNPALNLNTGVCAHDLGSDASFDEVNEAPESGYLSDTETSSAIGSSWHAGLAEPGRLQMTHNIYVICTREGKLAKLDVLSGEQGIMTFRYFYQPDCSRDLITGN